MTFEQARGCVREKLAGERRRPGVEEAGLREAAGRVLAAQVAADRDYPPVARAMRDGYAIRAADVPGTLRVTGEVRAGQTFAGQVGPGEAVEIMTGAPVPAGADAVVMVEHTRREGSAVVIEEAVKAGEAINPQGCEARLGETVIEAGRRIGFAEIAMLAAVGVTRVPVYARPRVAIVATGDEVVEVSEMPRTDQVRNSNAYSLAAQVERCGGVAEILPVARDEWAATRALIERGLEADLLLLSGGVSAGKYDIVERVLAELGAEFYFDRVKVQPGQPLVFGRVKEKLFFGLPGNPASTMVTFEVFARAAVEVLGGESEPSLRLLWTRLGAKFRHKPGLTRFLPARIEAGGERVTPVGWKGSGDMAALARANAFLVAEPERECWEEGDWIRVLPR